jgi:hypothetical protein
MFDSEGCAEMRGTGFAARAAYSRVSLLCAALVAMLKCVETVWWSRKSDAVQVGVIEGIRRRRVAYERAEEMGRVQKFGMCRSLWIGDMTVGQAHESWCLRQSSQCINFTFKVFIYILLHSKLCVTLFTPVCRRC